MAITLNGSTGITSPGGDTSTSLSTGLLTVTSSTVPTNGMYLPTTNTLAWATNSTRNMTLDASGNLGIGTSSPLSAAGYTTLRINNATNGGLLELTSNNTRVLQLQADSTGACQITTVNNGSNPYLAFGTNSTERARIDSSGNLLVGLTTPVSSSRLRINSANTTDSTICGTFQNGNNSELFSVYDAGAIRAQYIGTTTGTALILDASGYIKKSSSSRRYKTNEQPIDIGLDFILNLEPVSYDLIDGNIPQVGFIAEDFPDDRFVSRSMVDPSDESKGYQVEGVDYAHIVAPLVKAIQELTARLEALENK